MNNFRVLLIVDDNIIARMLVKKSFQFLYPDWKILEAESMKMAEEILSREKVDMLTVDQNMPDEDGLELALDVKKRYPDLNITLLTANIQKSVKDKTIAENIGFIEKPIGKETAIRIMKIYEGKNEN